MREKDPRVAVAIVAPNQDGDWRGPGTIHLAEFCLREEAAQRVSDMERRRETNPCRLVVVSDCVVPSDRYPKRAIRRGWTRADVYLRRVGA